ncbi:MAG: DUF192 domain-containing protein [Thermoplasmata archaeon]|nr:DUF192 domain-containing protein [Thermoplasmata archaeon]
MKVGPMSRLRLAGVGLGAVGLVLLGIGAVRLLDDGSGSSSARSTSAAGGLARALESVRAARAPFPNLVETHVEVGDHTLLVALARSESEREQGLRGRSDLGPYDGMVFVFPMSTSVAFTMSTVPVALDIGFYDTSGAEVTHLRMEPCAGSESQCPLYESTQPFRYALETLAGRLPAGSLH